MQFESDGLILEGELVLPSACRGAAVVCHPHPQYGGDMHNTVVCAITSALESVGFATLRFNFRGVGRSQGSYSGGKGESEDARAAVAYVGERSGASQVTLAGYSFGAMVALQAGADMDAVDRLIAVAPPLSFFELGFLTSCRKPKLFVAGECDPYCATDQLAHQLSGIAEPKVQRIIAGADHFFFGHESAVGGAVRAFMAD